MANGDKTETDKTPETTEPEVTESVDPNATMAVIQKSDGAACTIMANCFDADLHEKVEE